MKPSHPALFVLGLAFIAIGIASNRTFLALGLVFLVLGLLARRRAGRPS